MYHPRRRRTAFNRHDVCAVGVTESAHATALTRSFSFCMYSTYYDTLNTDFFDFFFQIIEGTVKEEKGEKINFMSLTLAVLKICRIFAFFLVVAAWQRQIIFTPP
jgi:hypothetical protein